MYPLMIGMGGVGVSQLWESNIDHGTCLSTPALIRSEDICRLDTDQNIWTLVFYHGIH